MTDLKWLLVVLAFLYLTECCMWVRRGSMVFRYTVSKFPAVVFPSRIVGNDRGGMVFLNPLAPLGHAFVCQTWPVSITEIAVYSYVAHSLDPAGRPRRTEALQRYDDIRGIWAAGSDVLINGSVFLQTTDAGAAKAWADFFAKVWLAVPSERSALIETAIDNRLDTRLLADRLDSGRQNSRGLMPWCYATSMLLFVVLPLSIWKPQLHSQWIPIVTAAVVSVVGSVIRFKGAHSYLFPHSIEKRRRALAILVFTPTAIVRAREVLMRDLLSEFDPLAVAATLCKPNDFRAFATQSLRDLREPRRPICLNCDPLAVSTERRFRERYLMHMEVLAARMGLNVDELLAFSSTEDYEIRSFCPRCGTGFTIPDGSCEQCGGIVLQPLYPTG